MKHNNQEKCHAQSKYTFIRGEMLGGWQQVRGLPGNQNSSQMNSLKEFTILKKPRLSSIQEVQGSNTEY